jgi:diguanylate cyclase (GGDEF)-like protein/PAS domain S-box-containing protein
MLVGISAGAVKTLSDDYRTAIGYLIILLLPTAIEMLLLMRSDTYILAFLLILYFFMQSSIVLHSYEQSQELERRKKEISEVQEELFEKEEMLDLFFDQAPIGIFSYDKALNITDCNKSFLTHFNLQKNEIIGTNLNDLSDKRSIEVIRNSFTQGTQSYIGPYDFLGALEFWVEGKYSPIYNKKGIVIGGMGIIEDKTKEHKALNELKYLASHDPLTSLCNRRGFREFMDRMIHEQKHHSHFSLLFYLDLNQFKNINDSLGHTFGDKLLIDISKRLHLLMDKGNNLTRLGGDEFIIVVPFVETEIEKAKNKADECVIKIQEIFNESFIIDGVRLHMKTSIGIVIIEPNFSNLEEIVRHADISMYQAKKHGHEHISYYNTQLDQERKKIFDLQHDLISALQENELKLFFQPIVNIKDDSLRAAEALVRWEHPEKGLIQPLDFIPLAIDSGVITDIGWWVLEEVCLHIEQWKKRGEWKLKYVSININAKQLIKSNFIDTFLSKLKQHGVENHDIKIEITETSLIDDFEITQEVIKEMQSHGIKCAIDDFGTGYSSLSYLKKLSFSVLKIDKEFIRNLLHNEENITLIRTIIEIGKQFNYNIVVEGIEEEAQKEIIKEIDDSLSYQGFLFSKPISHKEFTEKYLNH